MPTIVVRFLDAALIANHEIWGASGAVGLAEVHRRPDQIRPFYHFE